MIPLKIDTLLAFQYCNQIVPRYIPKMEILDYQNREFT